MEEDDDVVHKNDNPFYPNILKNGPFTPMIVVSETTEGDEVIPTLVQHFWYLSIDTSCIHSTHKCKTSLMD